MNQETRDEVIMRLAKKLLSGPPVPLTQDFINALQDAYDAGAISEVVKVRAEVERHGRKVEEMSHKLSELIAEIERTMLGQQRVQ